ncbi:FeoB-associated Cys-rich membrane protein [candidate division KSB1 bacterium]|nr:FeoB-associated Cys-rich membrane protein [candidate division KSB1 bacterium]
MNSTLQTIFVIITVSFAVLFLVKKFLWKPKKSGSNSCGEDDCGCH